jgi:hypothetical protein
LDDGIKQAVNFTPEPTQFGQITSVSARPWWCPLTDSGAPPSRFEDTHQSCNRGIVAFMRVLGSVMGANAVIVSRFAPISHAIGGVTGPIALIVPAIAAVRRRIVSIIGPVARVVDRRGRVTAETGPCANRIASVKCRSGRIM